MYLLIREYDLKENIYAIKFIWTNPEGARYSHDEERLCHNIPKRNDVNMRLFSIANNGTSLRRRKSL